MDTPVFVIHGIGNRDEASFIRTVDELASAVGQITAWPVYWGDLGARYELISDTVPGASVGPGEVRGEDFISRDGSATLARFLTSADEVQDVAIRSSSAVPALVIEAAADALAVEMADSEEIRDEASRNELEGIREALAEEWTSTTWLHQLDDVELLRAVGTALGRAVAEETEASLEEGFEVRGAEIKAIDVVGFVKRRLHDMDRIVGAALGAAGSRLNAHIRTSFLPGITQAVGDILVYQRHRGAIGDRVRKVIDAVDERLGRSPDHPVDIVAHSLGGVIAFDLATQTDPLWIRRLVTFGSQPSFFHVADPRTGDLEPYKGTPVQLPKSIGAWTNLWEPLDPLAFVAAPIFRLQDGSAPVDSKVPHLASSGLWTHSDYWKLGDVTRAIQNALAGLV